MAKQVEREHTIKVTQVRTIITYGDRHCSVMCPEGGTQYRPDRCRLFDQTLEQDTGHRLHPYLRCPVCLAATANDRPAKPRNTATPLGKGGKKGGRK